MKTMLMLVGAAVLAFSSPLAAQTFPAKGRTITMIVPNAAGGGTDTAARLIAPVMEKDLGVSVEVVNKPGGGTQVGASTALAAKPDGYTLFWSILPTMAGIYLDPDRGASFTRKDIQFIGNVYGAPFAVFVAANSPYKTIQDLIAAAKAKPKALKSATTGFMTTGHFANIDFQRATGVEMPTVNFDGGGPALTAILGGHVDVAFNSIGELLDHAKNGAIRILAVLDDQRSEFLPAVPTLKEQGVGGKPIGSYVGLSGPKGISKDTVEVLTRSLHKATQDPAVKARMASLGNSIMYKTPAEYDTYWADFEDNIRPLIAIAKQQSK